VPIPGENESGERMQNSGMPERHVNPLTRAESVEAPSSAPRPLSTLNVEELIATLSQLALPADVPV